VITNQVRAALLASVAALVPAGCAAGGSAPAPTAESAFSQAFARVPAGHVGLPPGVVLPPLRLNPSPGWMSRDARHFPLVYVSDYNANAVLVYDAQSPYNPIGTITNGIDGPSGTCVDGNGTLYVANEAGNTVTVYPRGKTTPSKVYRNDRYLKGPIGLAIGANGTLYVAEFEMNAVLEFDAGATRRPSRIIEHINQPEGVALDANNNLYVSYNNTTIGGTVEKFAPRQVKGQPLGMSVQYAGDVKFDAAGDLLLGDQIRQVVDFYRPGASTPFGSIAVGGDVFKFALNGKEDTLYVADIVDVPIFSPVSPGVNSTQSISGGLSSAYGVSTSPAAPL